MKIKETTIVFCAIVIGMICECIIMYQFGVDSVRREAVVAGHALWAYDDNGYPKFHWKEQQTVIGEYLGLGK